MNNEEPNTQAQGTATPQCPFDLSKMVTVIAPLVNRPTALMLDDEPFVSIRGTTVDGKRVDCLIPSESWDYFASVGNPTKSLAVSGILRVRGEYDRRDGSKGIDYSLTAVGVQLVSFAYSCDVPGGVSKYQDLPFKGKFSRQRNANTNANKADVKADDSNGQLPGQNPPPTESKQPDTPTEGDK